MKDWPLIVFTLATQIACGLSLAASAVDWSGDADTMRPLAVAIFPILSVGVALSMLHLKRPWMAWRSLANLRRSRLSREVLLTALFAILAFLYSASWWLGTTEGRVLLGASTGLSGIAAVSAGALVYTVPTQPVWNSGWVPMSFLGAPLLMGGLLPATLIPWNDRPAVLRVLLAAAIAGAILLLISAAWMTARVTARPWWLASHLLFATGIPIAAAIWLWSGAPVHLSPAGLLLSVGALFGAAVGRALMLAEQSQPF